MSADPSADRRADQGDGSGLMVDDVSVAYGRHRALDRVSVDIDGGRILAVLGPSGSGKSTLLRAVAGLEPLVSGRVVLDGRDLAGVPTHRRGLGLMFQDHGLFSHLDVAGNVAYGLRIAGVDRSGRAARVEELLALVGLRGFDGRRTDRLSGGEAQRVALARALAPEPGLLMLDEPLGSLDRALRDQLTADLRRLLTDLGQTAIHVTHDQAEAFALADRVAVLRAGRLEAVGAPAELWADPGTRFVAGFLGHPNLWSVEVDGEGQVRLGDRPLGRVERDHPLLATGKTTATVVAPTSAIVARPVDGGAAAGPVGTVTEVTFRQGWYDVAVTVDGPGPDVRFTTPDAPTVGDRLRLLVDCGALRPVRDEAGR
ncbi:MAG: ABC transporter ATP-binding protein [Actinomycetota bacterium]